MNCALCGEPMAAGEEMFKYHGHSRPCPKPPLPRPSTETMIEYIHRQDGDDFVLEVRANRELWTEFRFDTAFARQSVHNDLLSMMRSCGAKDMPSAHQ